jgi:hypothetical protein
MFRGRTSSQASLPPMKDGVVKGRPMTIDDESQHRKDAGDKQHENGSGKRRTFLGMHIGGGKDKDKDKEVRQEVKVGVRGEELGY